MTALEWLKTLRRLVVLLLVWNLVLSFCLVTGYMEKQETEQFQKICNLEAIQPFEILEEK